MENLIELKYKVKLSEKGITKDIITPFKVNFNDIKQVLIENTYEGSKQLSIYPNGCLLLMEINNNGTAISCNWPMVENDEGNWIILELIQ